MILLIKNNIREVETTQKELNNLMIAVNNTKSHTCSLLFFWIILKALEVQVIIPIFSLKTG